jgi:hypothetical protein
VGTEEEPRTWRIDLRADAARRATQARRAIAAIPPRKVSSHTAPTSTPGMHTSPPAAPGRMHFAHRRHPRHLGFLRGTGNRGGNRLGRCLLPARGGGHPARRTHGRWHAGECTRLARGRRCPALTSPPLENLLSTRACVPGPPAAGACWAAAGRGGGAEQCREGQGSPCGHAAPRRGRAKADSARAHLVGGARVCAGDAGGAHGKGSSSPPLGPRTPLLCSRFALSRRAFARDHNSFAAT